MSQSNSTTMNINSFIIQVQKLHVSEDSSGEGFVDFMVVNIGDLLASSVKGDLDGLGGGDTEINGVNFVVSEGDDSSEGLQAELDSLFFGHQD